MSFWASRNGNNHDSSTSSTNQQHLPFHNTISHYGLPPSLPQSPNPCVTLSSTDFYSIPVYQQVSNVPYTSTSPRGVASPRSPAGTGSVTINDIVFTNPFPSGACASPQAHSQAHVPDSRSNNALICPVYAYFGREPVFVTCPYCHNTDETRTELFIGVSSILRCFMIPIIGLFVKSARDTRHYCRNCLNIIAIHKP